MKMKKKCKICQGDLVVLKTNIHGNQFYDVCECAIVKEVKKVAGKLKRQQFNLSDMKTKLKKGNKTPFEWENGRMVFKTMEDAQDYFREDNNIKHDGLEFMPKFYKWCDEGNVKIRD